MAEQLINLGLEEITVKEAMDILRMFYGDAYQLAGEFHGNDRSDKFRENFPDEYTFAESELKTFVEAVRAGYAELLGKDHVNEYDKRRMYLAILLYEKMGQGKEKDNRLQLAPNSQQFDGDKRENKRIVRDFGAHGMAYKDLLMGSTRYH